MPGTVENLIINLKKTENMSTLIKAKAKELTKIGYKVEKKHFNSIRLRKGNTYILLISAFGKIEQHEINI